MTYLETVRSLVIAKGNHTGAHEAFKLYEVYEYTCIYTRIIVIITMIIIWRVHTTRVSVFILRWYMCGYCSVVVAKTATWGQQSIYLAIYLSI